MRRTERSGGIDLLGAALLVVSLLILAFLWHGAVSDPGLVVGHWQPAPAAR